MFTSNDRKKTSMRTNLKKTFSELQKRNKELEANTWCTNTEVTSPPEPTSPGSDIQYQTDQEQLEKY